MQTTPPRVWSSGSGTRSPAARDAALPLCRRPRRRNAGVLVRGHPVCVPRRLACLHRPMHERGRLRRSSVDSSDPSLARPCLRLLVPVLSQERPHEGRHVDCSAHSDEIIDAAVVAGETNRPGCVAVDHRQRSHLAQAATSAPIDTPKPHGGMCTWCIAASARGGPAPDPLGGRAVAPPHNQQRSACAPHRGPRQHHSVRRHRSHPARVTTSAPTAGQGRRQEARPRATA